MAIGSARICKNLYIKCAYRTVVKSLQNLVEHDSKINKKKENFPTMKNWEKRNSHRKIAPRDIKPPRNIYNSLLLHIIFCLYTYTPHTYRKFIHIKQRASILNIISQNRVHTKADENFQFHSRAYSLMLNLYIYDFYTKYSDIYSSVYIEPPLYIFYTSIHFMCYTQLPPCFSIEGWIYIYLTLYRTITLYIFYVTYFPLVTLQS